MKLFWILLLGLSTCQSETIETPPVMQGNSLENSSKKELLCKTWRLVQEIAGNDDGPTDTINYSIESKPVRIWEINMDSTYIVYTRMSSITSSDDRMNIEKGYWAFNDDSTIFGRAPYDYNGRINDNPTMSFYMNIVELTGYQLTTKVRGRGGYAFHTYIPLIKPNAKND